MSEKSNGLDGLAQPHLISQNAVQPLLMHGSQPVQTHMLVLTQAVLQQEGNLGFHLKVGQITDSGVQGQYMAVEVSAGREPLSSSESQSDYRLRCERVVHGS